MLEGNWNVVEIQGIYTGSCWLCSRKKLDLVQLKSCLEMKYMQSLPNQNQQMTMFGKKKRGLKAPSLKLEKSHSKGIQKSIGKKCGRKPKSESSKKSQQVFECQAMPKSNESKKTLCNPNLQPEGLGSIVEPLELGSQEKPGMKQVGKRTPKIRAPSSGTDTKGKKKWLLTNSAEQSGLVICSDGLIATPSALSQKEVEACYAPRKSGSQAISTLEIGTPTLMAQRLMPSSEDLK